MNQVCNTGQEASVGEHSPTPKGVTAPRPVTTTLRISSPYPGVAALIHSEIRTVLQIMCYIVSVRGHGTDTANWRSERNLRTAYRRRRSRWSSPVRLSEKEFPARVKTSNSRVSLTVSMSPCPSTTHALMLQLLNRYPPSISHPVPCSS